MFVIYSKVRATPEGDPEEFLICIDKQVDWIEYEEHEGSECIWLVPGTYDE